MCVKVCIQGLKRSSCHCEVTRIFFFLLLIFLKIGCISPVALSHIAGNINAFVTFGSSNAVGNATELEAPSSHVLA